MLLRTSPARKSLPLSLHLSLWLIGAAIFPLVLALFISEIPSRSSLITQASTLMATDVKTHAQLIDTYLENKEAIAGSLDNDPTVQLYLQHPTSFSPDQLSLFVHDGLALEQSLSPEVSLIEYFSSQGQLLLDYSIYGNKPQMHGSSLVPAEYLQRVLRGQEFYSDVYYDPHTHISSTALYVPVFASTTSQQVVGFVRNTLKLDAIWNIVKGETGANGNGSYAFLLDQNGVRIVDPDPHTLFTAIAPLSSQTQQQIQTQGFYGLHTQRVPVIADTTFQHIQNQKNPPASFQAIPADQHASFEITWHRLTAVPWTYFTLTPVAVVEAVANQQLFALLLIALLVLIPVAGIGWFVGKRISSPVLRSVDALKRNRDALNELAQKGKTVAAEQLWIIDASKEGLKSVEYYTRASQGAIWRLNDLGRELSTFEYQTKDTQLFLRDIESVGSIAKYLGSSIDYQDTSNKRVSRSIGVTNGIAQQLASGARSIKEVADEVDRVVNDLRQAVGGGL